MEATMVERSWKAAEAVGAGAPGEKLEDVVTPLSLASFVAPEKWEALRDLSRQIEGRNAEVARVAGKISEVEHALLGLDARRPKDASRIADALLKGEAVPVESEVTPEGLAMMGRDSLMAAKTGLQQKRKDLEGEVSWLTSRLRESEVDLLKDAVKAASDQYVERILSEVSVLHRVIEAGHSLAPKLRDDPFPLGAWRTEKILAPPMADRRKLPRADMWTDAVVVNYEGGAGVAGAVEAWRRAVKVAVGRNSL